MKVLYLNDQSVYLKVSKSRHIKLRDNMDGSTDRQKQLKLVHGMFEVTLPSETPYFYYSLQIQKNCKCDLKNSSSLNNEFETFMNKWVLGNISIIYNAGSHYPTRHLIVQQTNSAQDCF